MNLIKKTVLGVAAAGTALAVSAPAEAQYYYNNNRHNNTGAAVAAGIAGLAIGAIIGSTANHGGYYNNGYVYGNTYGSPYYNNGYYNNGYNQPYYNNGYYNTYPQYNYNYQTYPGYGNRVYVDRYGRRVYRR